ncbi:MAG: hypothetical protein ACR2H1_13115 [Limisphaerales bacterium]
MKLEKQRAAWLVKNPIKQGMQIEEVIRISKKLYQRFPLTDEERIQKAKQFEVEFVL